VHGIPVAARREALAREAMNSRNRRMDGRDCGLTWSTPIEAVGLIVRGATVRTAIPVAVIVGTVLSIVNEGQVVASGHAGATTGIRIGVNYAIPFVVASIGYVAPFRNRDSDQPGQPVERDGLDTTARSEEQADRPDPTCLDRVRRPPKPGTYRPRRMGRVRRSFQARSDSRSANRPDRLQVGLEGTVRGPSGFQQHHRWIGAPT